jgi:hypothetical protein
VFDAPGKLKSLPDRADPDSIGIKSATFWVLEYWL